MSEHTEIQQLEIDFKKDILKINGKEVKNKSILVSLPGPEGWERKKIFNHNLTTGNPGECEILEITYKKDSTRRAIKKTNIDERIEEQNKEIFRWLMIFFVSFITAIMTVIVFS